MGQGLIEATRREARQVLRDALAKEPTNAAALDLQKQIGPSRARSRSEPDTLCVLCEHVAVARLYRSTTFS